MKTTNANKNLDQKCQKKMFDVFKRSDIGNKRAAEIKKLGLVKVGRERT